MAEASERPADAYVTTQPPAGPDVGSAPAALEAVEPYRPLSILAVVGLALAVLYSLCVLVGGIVPFVRAHYVWFMAGLFAAGTGGAVAAILRGESRPGRIALFVLSGLGGLLVVVGLGGLLAYSGSDPWLMSPWFWLLVGAALFLCWFAWVRIRESEGALGGLALARWGAGLSLFFAAYYAVYLLGNSLAVNSQAEACAAEHLDLLRQGKEELAFLRTIAPAARPSESGDLASAIEFEFNTPRSEREPGQYTTFRHADYVQFIRLSGKDARFTRRETNWQRTPAGYVVTLTYDVESAVGEFELRLTVHSVEGVRGTRQWYVQPRPDGVTEMKSHTPAGIALFNALRATQVQVAEWISQVQGGEIEQAYLGTLSPGERKAQLPPDEEFRKGRQSFREGKLVSVADRVRKKKEVLASARSIFSRKPPPFQIQQLPALRMPILERDGERVRLRYPVRLMLFDIEAHRPQMMEAEILVEGPLREEPPPQAEEFRVAGLHALRAMVRPTTAQARP